MRKLSKLQESIWSDIQDRSSGEQIRKEDDINFLDRDGLYDYICANYEILKSRLAGIINSKTFNTLIVPVLMLEHSHTIEQLFFNFKFNKIRVMYSFPYSVEGLFDKLVDNFQLKQEGTGDDICYVISPKDESKVTNKFFIDLIDFIIENIPDKLKVIKKTTVNESVWSDIQDRSSGEITRKEDDVNLMNKDGFFDYLTKHYNIDAEYYMFKDANNAIVIPYYLIKSDGDYNFIYYYTDNNEVSLGFKIEEISPNLTRLHMSNISL